MLALTAGGAIRPTHPRLSGVTAFLRKDGKPPREVVESEDATNGDHAARGEQGRVGRGAGGVDPQPGAAQAKDWRPEARPRLGAQQTHADEQRQEAEAVRQRRGG